MPIYDYVCTQCGRSIEVMHGIHAPRPTTCEVCGGQLKKQVSTPAILFKGSGWAKRDARSSATKKAEAADSSPTGSSDSGSSDTAAASGAKPSESKATESKTSGDSGGSKDTPEAKPAPKPTGTSATPGKGGASKSSDTPGSGANSGS